MSQYTDEQLSRILSEHEGEGLARGGVHPFGGGYCIEQAAFNDMRAISSGLAQGGRYAGFDGHYDPMWTADEFLTALDEQGYVDDGSEPDADEQEAA